MEKQSNQSLWPIHPTFLSKTSAKPEDFSPNKDGIIESDTLRGFLADSSDDEAINNPLAMFQVVDASAGFNDKRVKEVGVPLNTFLKNILGGRKVVRIDSGNLYKVKPCCESFRELPYDDGYCTRLCYELDCQIIVLYHQSLGYYNIANDFEKYIAALKKICGEYNQFMNYGDDCDYRLQVYQYQYNSNKDNRFYIGYQCKYSHMMEYFFPIIHSGKVIAVLMQGQRIPKGCKKESLFPNYRKGHEALENAINSLDNKLFDDEPMGDKRLQAITNSIETLERRIDKSVLAYADSFISNEFMIIEREFHKNIENNNKEKGQVSANDFKQILDNTLKNICNIFNPDGFIRLYSSDSNEEVCDTITAFSLIGASDKNSTDAIPPKIKFEKLPEDASLARIQNEKLKEFLSRSKLNSSKYEIKISLGNNDTFRIDNLVVGKIKNLVWEKYSIGKEKYPSQFRIYSRYLKSMYHTLLEPYHLIKTIDMKVRMQHSMRYSAHESAQILPLVIDALQDDHVRKLIDDNMDDYSSYEIKIPSYIVVDVIRRLTLLGRQLRSPSLIFKSLDDLKTNMKLDWIDIHRIIYSVKSLFEKKADLDNNQRICIEFPDNLQDKFLLTDYDFMSHILFNLVDNAIKYGIRGSNIRISVNEEKRMEKTKIGTTQKNHNLVISVVNFGDSKIEDIEQIFDLYYRGEYSKNTVEGTGMGLFIVRKLSSLLGFQVECLHSELVASLLNLPMAYHYKRSKKNFDLSPDVQKKLNQDIDSDDINLIVNTALKDWNIGKRELENNIDQNIYKNEFLITIHLNTDNFKDNKL